MKPPPAPSAPLADTHPPDRPTVVRLLGVDYLHLVTDNGGDLYVTRHGAPVIECLKPENWLANPWFERHRERLKGTSTVYRVPTRAVGGRSIELVVKWSRVGQDVPLQTRILESVLNAEFNSPFEEFALVEELRAGGCGSRRPPVMTHRPLAIYVPPERLQLWQTGRSKDKIRRKLRDHPGVELDILRQYIMLYEYIRGIDAAEAFEQLNRPTEELAKLTRAAEAVLRGKGFVVADMKPAHLIVRKRNDVSLLTRRGQTVYALVDFELLQRTPEYEAAIRARRRTEYLTRQRERFREPTAETLPPHLSRVTIFGVDYVYGRVESTGGALWVVGRDPALFDYFQPERWRRPQAVRLSRSHHVFYTHTKDNVHLVWKASRVGERPAPEPDAVPGELPRMLAYGYNSPFEEFAFAVELAAAGVPVVPPRAIYRTGPHMRALARIPDPSRYRTHRALTTPDGLPILQPDHDYIKIWGYWNGPDDEAPHNPIEERRTIDLRLATQEGLIDAELAQALRARERARLAERGFEALNLSPHHLLIYRSGEGWLLADDGLPEVWLCNFELVRRVDREA